MRKNEGGGLVYSTDSGRMCPICRQPIDACTCKAAAAKPAGDGNVRISRETKGRAGKGVTLVKGLPLDDAELIALGKARPGAPLLTAIDWPAAGLVIL